MTLQALKITALVLLLGWVSFLVLAAIACAWGSVVDGDEEDPDAPMKNGW